MHYPEDGPQGSTVVLDFRAGIDPACDAAALRRHTAAQAAAEELRLIYVALTRAVHRCLVVVGNSAAPVGSPARAGINTPLNWLVAGRGDALAWANAQTAVEPAVVDQAWAALLDGATPPGPEPIALRALDAVLAGAGAATAPPAHEAALLQALPPPARVPAGWSIGSYSQLSRGPAAAGPTVDEPPDLAAMDHDAQAMAEPFGAAIPGTPAALAADDILRFPRGGAAGECIHRVFEQIDFCAPSTWPAAIAQALDGLPGATAAERGAHAAMLQRMLRDVCSQTLLPDAPGAAGLHLGALARERRLVELEFHLPAPLLQAEALQAALDQLGYPVPALGFGQLQGWLRGFIDLVFEHAGRWYLLDWKSNHLGPNAADYHRAACRRAMAAEGYHLQALVYALALHRLLRLRLPGYDAARHFGGVAYVFVRGFRPGWVDPDGQPCGLWFDRPTPATLQRLDALLQGRAR